MLDSQIISSATICAVSVLMVGSSFSIFDDLTSSAVLANFCIASTFFCYCNNGSDVSKSTMAVLLAIVFSSVNEAEYSDDLDDGESDTLEHPDQIDKSFDELRFSR